MNERRKKGLIALGFLISGLILGAAIVHALETSFSTYISGGSMASVTTIFRDGDYYFVRDGLTGKVNVDTNFTNLFNYCQDNLPSYGGTIHLKTGYYEGHVLIYRDGVTLEGETVYQDIPAGIPDNPPTVLYGSVLKVTEAGMDAIHISGQRYGIVIRDLGIWFDVSTTGHGITTDMGQAYTVTHMTIENIKVLNHDKSHYAIQIANFLHCKVSGVLAWGGPLLHLYNNMPYFQPGNSIFDLMYGYIKYDLYPIIFADGPYPILIQCNDSLPDTGRWQNLMNFRRIQINNPTGCSDPDYFTCVLWNVRYSEFQDLNFESSNCQSQTLLLGSCKYLTFTNIYMWEQDPGNAYVDVASNNEHITFVGGSVEKVVDRNNTDVWIGTNILEIDWHSVCGFIDLPGNSGYGEIENGQSNLTVTATFIGYNYMVHITPLVEADNQEPIRVKNMWSAPTNQFVVETASGNATTGTVGFFWKVMSMMTATPPF